MSESSTQPPASAVTLRPAWSRLRGTLVYATIMGILSGTVALVLSFAPHRLFSLTPIIVALSSYAVASILAGLVAVLLARRRCRVAIAGDTIWWRDVRRWRCAQLDRRGPIRVWMPELWERRNLALVALIDGRAGTRWLDLTPFAPPGVRKWIAATFGVDPGSLEIAPRPSYGINPESLEIAPRRSYRTAPRPFSRTAPSALGINWRFAIFDVGLLILATWPVFIVMVLMQ
jgi:hypothetical protein